jgi:hypothetical protein
MVRAKRLLSRLPDHRDRGGVDTPLRLDAVGACVLPADDREVVHGGGFYGDAAGWGRTNQPEIEGGERPFVAVVRIR